jgi:hypothetical protein
MGFNRRKMEDERRRVAEKEAAGGHWRGLLTLCGIGAVRHISTAPQEVKVK